MEGVPARRQLRLLTGSVRKDRVRFPHPPRMKQSVIVEIRAAEGGADSKLLVEEQKKIYIRLCGRRSL